ncbi:hypothetical protein [Ferrimonas lipolytica]|uniref:Uncharacterized protein n=1 Tax=Ferrimonas lipolytica TaxID=2724191 RepID=A0A6H1UJ05_9GAMM|nr:hypothetical protein [Ferrimonas lipolytica]QIZ77782.1 hypothetical protein HER31_13270 [Ferrimonas lipolytica]
MFAVKSILRRGVLAGLVFVGVVGSVSAQGLRNDIDAEIKQQSLLASSTVQQQALHNARVDAWNALMGYQSQTGLLTLEQEVEHQSEQIAAAAKRDALEQAQSYWEAPALTTPVAIAKIK